MQLSSIFATIALLGGALASNDCSISGSWGTLNANDAWENLRIHVENGGTHEVKAGTAYSWQVGNSKFCVRNRGSGSQTITNLQIARTMLYNLQKCCSKQTCYPGWADYSWGVYVTLIPSSKDCNAY